MWNTSGRDGQKKLRIEPAGTPYQLGIVGYNYYTYIHIYIYVYVYIYMWYEISGMVGTSYKIEDIHLSA